MHSDSNSERLTTALEREKVIQFCHDVRGIDFSTSITNLVSIKEQKPTKIVTLSCI